MGIRLDGNGVTKYVFGCECVYVRACLSGRQCVYAGVFGCQCVCVCACMNVFVTVCVFEFGSQ